MYFTSEGSCQLSNPSQGQLLGCILNRTAFPMGSGQKEYTIQGIWCCLGCIQTYWQDVGLSHQTDEHGVKGHRDKEGVQLWEEEVKGHGDEEGAQLGEDEVKGHGDEEGAQPGGSVVE